MAMFWISVIAAGWACCAVEAMTDGAPWYPWYSREAVSDAPGIGYFLNESAAAYGAVCLDGSPPAYYYRAANTSADPSAATKWYIHHQGGGWCEDLSSCLQRAGTDLGSSKNYPKTADLGGGYFSSDPTVNPQLYAWNSVFIRYCDGGSFSGDNDTVTTFNGSSLYFRGHRILLAVMHDLYEHRGLDRATDVVISGCSAGGLATYLHVDEWADMLGGHVKVRGMPDSGFFLDYESPAVKYHSGMKWVFEYMNSTEGVNRRCIDAHRASSDTWMCIFAEHTSPHIQTPIFPLQAEYDSWQIDNDLHNSDPTTINQWGANLTSLVQKNLLGNPAHGIFLDSCKHHCGMWGDIRINGDLQAVAFQKWYDGKDAGRYLQDKTYPCDSCCKP